MPRHGQSSQIPDAGTRALHLHGMAADVRAEMETVHRLSHQIHETTHTIPRPTRLQTVRDPQSFAAVARGQHDRVEIRRRVLEA